MDNNYPIHPFELFPRQELFQGITRREFFASIIDSLVLFSHRSSGSSALRISTLGILSNDELKEIIPKIEYGIEIFLKNQSVWFQPEGDSTSVHLFTIDKISSFTFNLLNGENSIYEISEKLSIFSGLTKERSFAYTRGFFLTLVKVGVCSPTNNPQLG